MWSPKMTIGPGEDGQGGVGPDRVYYSKALSVPGPGAARWCFR